MRGGFLNIEHSTLSHVDTVGNSQESWNAFLGFTLKGLENRLTRVLTLPNPGRLPQTYWIP